MSKKHRQPSQEQLPEVNWRSFYEAGAITRTEYFLVRSVEQDPSSCSISLLQQYFLLRAKHGLLPGAKAPELQIASAGEATPTEAFDAYMEANNELNSHHSLKVRLLFKILNPDSKYFGRDYRREWNRMAGFELFDLSKEQRMMAQQEPPKDPTPLVDEDEKEQDQKDDDDASEEE